MNATTDSTNKNITSEVKATLEKVRSNPRIIFALAAAVSISIVVALLLLVNSPDYRVLYNNITDQEGGAVITQLTQMQVPYRFEEHGGAILVPAERIYEVRLKLAQQGLPKGGAIGFELLDQEKFGISQFTEQVNFQRALEGELSRTIETLGPVTSARVHLAIPKPTLFVREQKKSSASVTLALSSGRVLEPSQVNAIAYLISSSVPELNASDVTIVDQAGNLLTQSAGQATQTSQLKYTNEIENDYQNRILSILTPIVGANNVKAQVTAQIDFSEHEQTAEQYQPNSDVAKMAVRSKQQSTSLQGGRVGSGGVPGALSNQPPLPVSTRIEQSESKNTKKSSTASQPQQSTAKNTNVANPPTPWNERNDETINYELDRTLTHVRKNAGVITRLSAAVVINYLPDDEGKNSSLTSAQLEQINSLVKEAIGYSNDRGDTLNIVNAQFSAEEKELLPPLWKQPEFISALLIAARYLMVVIVAWVLWRKAVQPFWLKHHEMALQRLELEKEARLAEADAKLRRVEDGNRAKAQKKIDSELNTQKLRELAEQDPQVISLVLRQWINKEQK